MRPALTYNSLHNPFHNRFNDPVTCRRDEMQANAYKVWLRERNQGCCQTQSTSTAVPSSLIGAEQRSNVSDELETIHGGGILVVFTLLLVLLASVAVLLKAF